MIENAERERLGNPQQPDKPLIRLRVSPILDQLNLIGFPRIVLLSLFCSVTPLPMAILLCGMCFSPSPILGPSTCMESFPSSKAFLDLPQN